MPNISFFQALKPYSPLAGVYTREWVEHDETPWQLHDLTVTEAIQAAWRKNNVGMIESVKLLCDIIMGSHYKNIDASRIRLADGSKGLLDFLIFPLLARKCIFYYLRKGDGDGLGVACGKIAAFAIGALLEIPRGILGFGLTLLLAPIAMLINFFKPTSEENPLFARDEYTPRLTAG